MNGTNAVETLAKQMQRAIKQADHRRRKHKTLSVFIRVMATASSATVPVLLGFRQARVDEDILANVAMILAAFTTVLIAYEAFYGHRELWAINTAAASQLRRLELEFDYLISKPGTPALEDLDRLHDRLAGALTEADSAWVGVRQMTARQPAPQPQSIAVSGKP
jgi:hypothetical protein